MQIDERRFNRLALSGVVAGFVLMLTALAAIIMTLVINQRSAALVNHTYQVGSQLAQLQVLVERAETGARGYLVSPDPARLETFEASSAAMPDTIVRLARLTSDNPVQQQNIANLKPLIAEEFAKQSQFLIEAQAGRLDNARALFKADVARRRVASIRQIAAAMGAEEQRLLNERSANARGVSSILFVILGVTGALLMALGIAVFVIVRGYTESLTRARDRLHLLNTDLEGVVSERTADLRRANDEIQRFAYIVSHDLRSPLVNILGFTAELEETNKSLGALLERAEKEAPQIITPDSEAAREDLPEAIGFIRSSTQKMDRLINAILKLSREGRRTLTPQPLDMDEVLGGIVGSIEHRLVELGATATVEHPIPDLVSDRVAIEQIFSNLIENASKYLQPGRPGEIVVRGYEQGDRLIYEVEDNGRGIDPKDHQRVFDLFRRSGTQDQPGEGIGLAHVRALAYRLGGFIDLKSELGQGATFQVNLPATYTDEEVLN